MPKTLTLHHKLGDKARQPETTITYKGGQARKGNLFAKDTAPLKLDGKSVTFNEAPDVQPERQSSDPHRS